MTSVRFNPGPGAYEPKASINQAGTYILSSMRNTLTPSISLPSLDRGRGIYDVKPGIPGPGQYQ